MIENPYKLKEPKYLKQYIVEKLAVHTYLITDSKRWSFTCTRCGYKGDMSELTRVGHNDKNDCPSCFHDAIIKEKRYGRKGLTDTGRILWTAKHGRYTYAQLDEYDIDYTELEPKVILWASAQYRFSKEGTIYYKHVPSGWWSDERWEARNRIRLPSPPKGYGWYCSTYVYTYLYPELRYGTDLKYAGNPEDYNLAMVDASRFLIGYLDNFLKYPAIELLEKAGFKNLVECKAFDQTGRPRLNYKAKDIRKIIGLNWGEIKEWQKTGGKPSTLRIYKEERKKYPWLTFENILALYRYDTYINHEAINELEKKNIDIKRVVEYIVTQRKKESNAVTTIKDYLDYVNDLEVLNIKPSNKTLYPKHFQDTHMRMADKKQKEKDKLIREKFIKAEKQITMMEKPWMMGELLIRPATDSIELDKESHILKHCVKTYKDKVASGKTAILFIRRQDEPDLPYYTLELNSKREIVQVRGRFNCNMTDEVKDFTDEWYKWLKKEIKKGETA